LCKEPSKLYSQKNVLEYIQSIKGIDLNELLNAFAVTFKLQEEEKVDSPIDEILISQVV
jgi:hypothetical protein